METLKSVLFQPSRVYKRLSMMKTDEFFFIHFDKVSGAAQQHISSELCKCQCFTSVDEDLTIVKVLEMMRVSGI